MKVFKVYEAKIYDKEARIEICMRVNDFTLKNAISYSRGFVKGLNQRNFDNTDAKNKRRYVLRRVRFIFNIDEYEI